MTTAVDLNSQALPILGDASLAAKEAAGSQNSGGRGFQAALADAQSTDKNNQLNQLDASHEGQNSGQGGASDRSASKVEWGSAAEARADRSRPGAEPDHGAAKASGSALSESVPRQQLPLDGKDLPEPSLQTGVLIAASAVANAPGTIAPNAPAETHALSPSLLASAQKASPLTGVNQQSMPQQSTLNAAGESLLGRTGQAFDQPLPGVGAQAALQHSREAALNLTKDGAVGTSISTGAAAARIGAQFTDNLKSDRSLAQVLQSGDTRLSLPSGSTVLGAAQVAQFDRAGDLGRRVRGQASSQIGLISSAGRAAQFGATASMGSEFNRQQLFADLLMPKDTPLQTGSQLGPNLLLAEPATKAAIPLPLVPNPIFAGDAGLNPTFRLPSGFEVSGASGQGQMLTPFQQAAWAQELAQQAKFMVRDELRFVELKLNPANLGSIEVVLKQEDDQTTLMFFAKNQLVREALESSLQRLQKSFSDDGLQLDEAFVSDQSLAEHKESEGNSFADTEQYQSGPQSGLAAIAETNPDTSAGPLIPANDHRIDLWA